MESKNENKESKDKIPKERRKRTKETEGKFDDDGFFTTPNGSFWDMDGEYFNRYGYDIHGGKYIDKLDYIPGPTWIEELGCYPEDKDKYLKEEDLNEDDEDMKDIDMDNIEGDEDLINDMKMLKVNEDIKEEKKSKKENDKKNENKKKKNKKKKEESFDEDEWEEIED
jgi:hypothetical protein